MSECPIKVARKVKRLTQAQLAEKTGCTNTAIANIERGSRLPSLRLVLRMAPVLDLSFQRLAQDSLAYYEEMNSTGFLQNEEPQRENQGNAYNE